MDFFDAVEQRHSYRGTFTSQPVPRQDVEKILRAGVLSPTGHNFQTPYFVAVTNKALLRQIAEIVPKSTVQTAPVVLFVLSSKCPMENKVNFEDADYAAATQSMMLAVTALGYATVWLDGFLRNEQRAEALGRLLQAPAGHTVRVMLPVGVPAEPVTQAVEKKPFEERARMIE